MHNRAEFMNASQHRGDEQGVRARSYGDVVPGMPHCYGNATPIMPMIMPSMPIIVAMLCLLCPLLCRLCPIVMVMLCLLCPLLCLLCQLLW